MKFSKFNIITEKMSNGNYIMRNLKNEATIEINEALKETLLDDKFEFLDNEVKNQLVDMEFIVDDNEEIESYLKKFDSERMHLNRLSIFLTMTLNCNLSCIYCFEDGIKTNLNLDVKTFDAIYEWIESKLKKKNYNSLYVNFFGGEPLLNQKMIKYSMGNLFNMCKINNIKPYFAITTNATLLNEDIIEFMVNNGLVEAQITLDGKREDHDIRRKSKDGKGSYDTILKKSKYFYEYLNKNAIHKDGKGFCFRVNVEPNNYKGMKEMIDNLVDNGFLGCRIYFSPIVETFKAEEGYCAATHCTAVQFDESSQLVDIISDITQYAADKGFHTQRKYRTGPCMDISADDCLFDPEGNMYKCLEMVGHKEQIVGNVFREQTNEEKKLYDKYLDLCHLKKCVEEKCSMLPVCSGGCRVDSMIKTGKLKERICQKKLIERLNKSLILTAYNHK